MNSKTPLTTFKHFWQCNRAILLICAFVAAPLFAENYVAEGRDSDQEKARQHALEALASSLYVRIQSETTYQYSTSSGEKFTVANTLISDIPLLGSDTRCARVKRDYICKATIQSEKSGKLYRQELNKLRTELDQGYHAKPKNAANRHSQLTRLLAVYEEYEKHAIVANLLGVDLRTQTPPSTSKATLINQLVDLEKRPADLRLAAHLLSRDLNFSNIEVYPAFPEGSHEVTQFARALQIYLQEQIQGSHKPSQSDHTLRGTYLQTASGVRVSYSLIDEHGKTLSTRVVDLPPESYQGLQTTPTAKDFDELLHSGYVVSSDLLVNIATNKGQQQLYFVKGEEIEVLVKFNNPAYFYVVGHIKSQAQEMSYLVDLSEIEGARKFVKFVNADDANKWISLGSFEVEPPYGVESLQLIAAATDLASHLPPYEYDSRLGYFLISRKIDKGIDVTRGLKRVKQDFGTVAAPQIRESVLMYTTLAE